VPSATERQFLSDTWWSIPDRLSPSDGAIQFPSRYFYLTDGGAVMDTQKPLTSVYRILPFAMQFSSERSIDAQNGGMSAQERTLELPYIITRTFTTARVYAPSFDAQVSYFFIVCLKRGASSRRPT